MFGQGIYFFLPQIKKRNDSVLDGMYGRVTVLSDDDK